MRLSRPRPFAFVLLLLAACTGAPPPPAAAPAPQEDIVADARAFMEAYGRDLAAGDREAIAGRYDRRGAYFVFNGRRDFSEWEPIRQQYLTQWQAPAAFEWRDLIYEPAGPGAIVVNGDFLWTIAAEEPPMVFSYTGLLVRQDGVLRIRLEDEAMSPATLLRMMPADTTPG